MRLSALEWGDASAPPLLCVHGVTSHALRYRRLGVRLAESFRVVSVDLRGHGDSGWEPPWDLETHVADLLETADDLGVGAADWIGHSWGGRIVLELAARVPERVRRLVLLDPAVWVPPPTALDRAERQFVDESYGSPEEAVEARLPDERPAGARALLEQEIPENLELGEDGRWRYRYSRPAVIAAFGEMAKRPPLEQATAPALLVRGEDSDVVPPPLVETTRELYGGPLEVVDVPGGHIVTWDALEETTAAVERFLST